MPDVKKTCLYDSHVRLNARMEEFAGYWMPIVYTSIPEEHKAVREKVGMFDVSHMGEILVKGKDALAFVDHVFTNEITSKSVGKVVYGMFLYPNGTIVDDLLVYKKSDTECLLVVNASNIAKDYEWIIDATEGFEVVISNQSDDISEIALQGPLAEASMRHIFDLDLSNLEFFTFTEGSLFGVKMLISRTGYTGEDGFEIYGPAPAIAEIWEAFLSHGVIPCGLGARDTLRFEAALPLYGHEISDTITPLEAGFKLFVRMDKPDFIGKSQLEQDLALGLSRKLVGFELKTMAIPRQGYPLYLGNREVGHITTGYLSITLGKPIAMALVSTDVAKNGSELEVLIRNKRIPGVVRDKKFLSKNYKK